MLNLISLPTDFVSTITANSTSIISDLSPFVTLILGVLLGVLVISVLIGAIKR